MRTAGAALRSAARPLGADRPPGRTPRRKHLTNEAVREQVGLVHDVIADSFVINRFGEHDLSSTEVLIWHACREGMDVLGRYLRDQAPQAPTELLTVLRRAHDTAYAEMER